MWKRLNNNQKGARQPGAAGPTTGYDADVFEDDFNRSRSPPERSRLQRPPREDTMRKGLPSLPFEPVPPPPPEDPDSRFRPVSSIYSEPSPAPINTRFPRHEYQTPDTYREEEVSPPSSPEFGRSQAQHVDEEVSPIDEMPDISRLGFGRPGSRQESSTKPPSRPGSSSKPPSSNIPVLRREKRRNQVAAAAANLVQRKEVGDGARGPRNTKDVRWDPYSGEITNSGKGKPQSVKPGEFTPPGLRPVHGPTGIVLGNQSTISAGGPKPHTSFGERVRNLKPQNVPAERPEWKGATGRVALVAPVADQPDIPPLNIPRKSSKRVASPVSGNTTPVSVIRYGGDETGRAPAQRVDPTIRTVLSNSGQNSPGLVLSPVSVTPEPVAPGPLARNPVVPAPLNVPSKPRGETFPPAAPHQRKDSAGTIERNFREALQKSFHIDPSEPYVQPPSRFSVTTYATSTGGDISPRASMESRPPMPTPPQQFTTTKQPSPPSPILTRKRPKIGESPKATTRKAINPESPVVISMSSSIATKRASNIAKTLPQSPAEAESHDLISSLQAQLDNLSNRRNNIMKSIRQMTELMPTDSVVETAEVRRKRDEEKRKVEYLREEEADVRRQEHDIGLRLHRAWKRRDKDADYEPTGLWVRRVTGVGKD